MEGKEDKEKVYVHPAINTSGHASFVNPNLKVPECLSLEEYFKNQYLKCQNKLYKWGWEQVTLLGSVGQGRKSAFRHRLALEFLKNATACVLRGGWWISPCELIGLHHGV